MGRKPPYPISVMKSVRSDGSIYVFVTYCNSTGEEYTHQLTFATEMQADNYIETKILPHIRKKP